MPTTTPDTVRDTRNRLLEAALLVFAEKGFDGAGIRDIAARAKANSAMVQYHFGGKEGLYLAVMRHTFEVGTRWSRDLPPVPEPGRPGAREGALACLRAYIHGFLDHALSCGHVPVLASQELDRAADLLWNREMQYPRANLEAFLRESIVPIADYLQACMGAILPDLDDEQRLRMGFTVQSLLMWNHTHMGVIRLLRGSTYGPADLESLVEHFYRFCLGGFGLEGGLECR